jgi:hypothetical protein
MIERDFCYICEERPAAAVGPYHKHDGICRQCATAADGDQMTPWEFVKLCGWMSLFTAALVGVLVVLVRWLLDLSVDGWQNLALALGGVLVVLLVVWCARLERRAGGRQVKARAPPQEVNLV